MHQIQVLLLAKKVEVIFPMICFCGFDEKLADNGGDG